MNTNASNRRRRHSGVKYRQSSIRQSRSSLPLNASIGSRRKDKRAARSAARAEYLASLPKGRFKRLGARLRPGHLVDYWFSADGVIMALKIIGIGIISCFFIIIGLFAYFKKDILAFNSISGANLGGSISFYDRTGSVLLWQDYNSVKRMPVTSNEISPYVKEATVAIEDKNFYHEGGFNFGSILRAGFHDLLGSGGLQGASTITEQVVKMNKGWPDPLTITEKIEEIILSVELSRDYSKNQILTAYLNIAPYGNIDYGVQAAAEDYFHISASQLTLAQSAFLAAIPQAPTAYSPYSSPQYNAAVSGNYFDEPALIARQHYVLDQMVIQHMITQQQADAAKQVNVLAEVQPLESKYQNIKAPYFVLAAKQQLLQTYGSRLVKHGAWKVVTTLSVPLQNLADSVVQANLPHAEANGANEEALVAEQVQTGQIIALVGGTNFNNPQYGQINYAQVNLSPGSSIKPYVYSAYINSTNDVGAGSVIYDVQQPLPGYPCTNKSQPQYGGNCLWDYDFRYPGAETVRYALAGSRNVPAVKAGLMAGMSNVQKTVSAMTGFSNAYRCYAPGTNVTTATKKDQVPCYGSAAIGEGGYLYLDQAVNGISTLARLGKEIPETYILSITDSSGKTIYQWKQPTPTQAIKQDTAYIIDNILSDPRASYLPGYCTATSCTPLSSFGYKWQRYNGWDIAIKTGTTHANISGLMTAWDTQYAVETWASYYTVNKPMTAGAMEYVTEPLARNWMQGALSMIKTKPVNWVQPSDIKVLPSFVQRAHVGVGSQEPGPTTDIFPSWYVGNNSGGSTEVIDKVSGDLATSCTPADARETINGANANIFSADKFYPPNQSSTSATISAYDPIHQCNDQLPAITLTAPATCSNTDNSGQGCQLTIAVTQGTHPLSGGKFGGTVAVTINGSTVQNYSIPAGSNNFNTTFYYSPPPSSNGNTVSVAATVTDSVLYQSTDSAKMQLFYTAPASNTTTPSNTSTGTNSGGTTN